MESSKWTQMKAAYPLGHFVRGQVEFHAPFGIFLTLDDSEIKGLIKIPDFLDEGEMSTDMYPAIGKTVGAVVVGYNESNCSEIYLSAKPSVLHKVLVPLQTTSLAA